MRLVNYWYLEESFNMMKRIGMREMMNLCELLVMKSYRKGQYIKTEDQPDDTIFFIKKGQVKIGGFDAEGNETLRYILGKGHIFGESRLMGDSQPEYFAKTQSETQICYISADMMENLMEQYPKLNNSVTKVSWKKVSKLERRLNGLLYKDAKTRIIDFLKDHLREYGIEQGDGSFSSKTVFSHSDIAKLTSTSRQTVNNVISNYRKEGLLFYDRSEFGMRL
ncbi:Crp/Fnr family transcriptional regulator [Roseivirga sp. E12]|uniref:Crp/Fnr family transcriptional regulator n=1 Tax=Roseivirga sp. E12 TaxID=2819237 RepID=UPI001ABC512A|nr:Crp/Fnr family transcriptional regulator [Roseivirga sp. E12]MBO3699972.1 Crp/Fnr family transcriptional regulator [Roseivirga sp. E12]